MGDEATDTHVEVFDAGPTSGVAEVEPVLVSDTAATVDYFIPAPPSHSALDPSSLPAAESDPPASSLLTAPPSNETSVVELSPEPDSPETSAASSTFSNLRLSPERRPSTPRSSARSKHAKKHRKHAATTAAAKQPPPPPHVDDDTLSLIDPIYLLPSPSSPPQPQAENGTVARGRVGWHRVVVYRFPLTADASKVPGDARSYYSVGLDYSAAEEREECGVEEWETRRGNERSKRGCPELSSEERMEVWSEAQEKLKAEADEKVEAVVYVQQKAEPGDAVMLDVAQPAEPLVALHSHNLRKRQPPQSPVLAASQTPPQSHSPPPLLFTDVSELTCLRASRARIGCSCTVPVGDRHTKVCSAPWLQQSKRAAHQHPTDQPDSDYMAGHDAREVACECLRAGVGCNSNTCACFSYCCRNPHERYLFNAGRVNGKRRRILDSIRAVKGGKSGKVAVAVDGDVESAGNGIGGKGKNGHAGKRRGRKRAQSV